MTDKSEFKEWKEFHIGDVLTITTGIMVSPEGIGGVYQILDWMTGDQLFTHQLPRASDICEPILKGLYPEIAKVEIPDASNVPESLIPEFWIDWLAKKAAIHGEKIRVPKLTTYTPIDPLEELITMRPDATIIMVDRENPESAESAAKTVAEMLKNGN